MRYFFFHWYRPADHGDRAFSEANEEYLQVVTVEVSPLEAARLRDMRDEIAEAADSDKRPSHQATVSEVRFSQEFLSPLPGVRRVYPLLMARSLDVTAHQSAKVMASRVKNRISRLIQTSDFDRYGHRFTQDGWTLIPTEESKLLPYTMSLCDFAFTCEGIQIITKFGVTTSLPWEALQYLESLAPGGNPRVQPQEMKKIKRQTILVR